MFAVRQGKPLARNLRRALLGKQPGVSAAVEISQPYFNRRQICHRRARLVGEGQDDLDLKDWIDRRFMDKFNDLPDMAKKKTMSCRAGWQAPMS